MFHKNIFLWQNKNYLTLTKEVEICNTFRTMIHMGASPIFLKYNQRIHVDSFIKKILK